MTDNSGTPVVNELQGVCLNLNAQVRCCVAGLQISPESTDAREDGLMQDLQKPQKCHVISLQQLVFCPPQWCTIQQHKPLQMKLKLTNGEIHADSNCGCSASLEHVSRGFKGNSPS